MDESLQLTQQTALRQRLMPQQVLLGRYLEMTAPEIEDEVHRALDENPALETAEPRNDTTDDAGLPFEETAEELQRADYSDDDMPATDLENRGHIDDASAAWRYDGRNHSADDVRYEPMAVDDDATVIDVLRNQLSEYNLDDFDRELALYIIGNIDSNGYLGRSYAAMADDVTFATGRDVDSAKMRRVGEVIRSMDPAGVGAVDLRDCLLLQLRRMTPTEAVTDAITIVADYFDLFSKRHFERLQSRASLSQERLSAALEVIRGLNPKPGALIETVSSSDRLRHIVPDFYVEAEPDGRVTVSLNNQLPELTISRSFMPDETPDGATTRDRKARTFIKARYEEARNLISLLKSRRDTLLSVMEAIARIQSHFFATGNEADLKPMILKDVAAMTGLDLSVISRATAGKYVATPRGVWPLKKLFNERRKDDSDTSAHEILAALRKLIEAEDKHRPLPDEELKDRLQQAGYDIARRTVAKYREQLGLPVARLRRTL